MITLNALQTMLADAKKKAPELAARLEKAAMIVATQPIVEIAGKPGVFLVPSMEEDAHGNRKTYEAGIDCTCVDFKQGKAPKGHCKHKVAVVLFKRLEAAAAKEEAIRVAGYQSEVDRANNLSDALEAASVEMSQVQAVARQKVVEAQDAAAKRIMTVQRQLDDVKAANAARNTKAFTAVRALFNALGDE